MRLRKIYHWTGLTTLLLASGTVLATGGAINRGDYLGRKDVDAFIQSMHDEHGIEAARLRQILGQAHRQNRVLELVRKPAEGKPWSEYRPIFMTEKRITAGVTFWNEHADLLEQASAQYGVPPEIIVAILGVETFYGTRMGKFPVLDTLVTLGFDYPKRADFFRGQLSHFLLLAQEEGMNPMAPKGSYAAAMGMGQFIPSSYRDFAVDFDHNGVRDLFHSPADGIGSVANYFHRHEWQPGEPVIVPAKVTGNRYKQLRANERKPAYSFAQLHSAGVTFEGPHHDDELFSFLELEGKKGKEYWVGYHNFYVITRYNHSVKYALAVYQLSDAIKSRRNQSSKP